MKESICVCRLCLPKAVEHFELVEGYWLFENEGTWGLMVQPGHGLEYCVLRFPEKPWADPDPKNECDEGTLVFDASGRWFDVVCDWDKCQKMAPEAGYWLVESCKQAGWNKESDHPVLLQWLFDRAGTELLKRESIKNWLKNLDK